MKSYKTFLTDRKRKNFVAKIEEVVNLNEKKIELKNFSISQNLKIEKIGTNNNNNSLSNFHNNHILDSKPTGKYSLFIFPNQVCSFHTNTRFYRIICVKDNTKK